MTRSPSERHMLPRYERPREAAPVAVPLAAGEPVPFCDLEARLAVATVSPGGKDLLRGLLRLGRAATFAGGGAGIEYGSLLKTATRPRYIASHVNEVAAHLHEREVDVLVVPGMSGYPVGSMYSIVSGIPAVLLKKQKLAEHDGGSGFPPGAFVIPSYTGDGDVLMSADPASMQDIVDEVIEPQLRAQQDGASMSLRIRVAGADDIIDKATMSQAVSDSALIVGRAAIDHRVARYRRETGDPRPVDARVEVVAWVTPLIKGYNRPHEHLRRWFGVTPFAGINVTSVHHEASAIGVEGVGVVAFATRD